MSRNPILAEVRPGDNLWCRVSATRAAITIEAVPFLDGSAEGDAIRIRGMICLVEPRGFEPQTTPCNRSM
jgi:hypothetical protein